MAKMPRQKPGESKQDYGTPDDFLKSVLRYLHIPAFHTDLACRRDNKIRYAQNGIFWPKQDSLLVPWPETAPGEWNWLNPPFDKIAPWAEKCATAWLTHGTWTALLVPSSTGSNWWESYVHDIGHVLFVKPRLTFKGTPINPKTRRPDPYPKDVALILYGETPGYDIWRWR